MKITVNKQVSTPEEVEIETPAYFKNPCNYISVTEKGLLKVGKEICVLYTPGDGGRFKDELEDAIKREPATETEFNDAYVAFLERCNQITGMLTEI